jgi:hypothetical protein
MWKRVFVVLLGMWLIFSSFAFAHRPAHLTNGWLTGAGLILFGALSMIYPWARTATIVLAVWLFLYAVMIGTSTDPVTFWNDAFVALAVFVLSMLQPQRTYHTPPTQRDQTA